MGIQSLLPNLASITRNVHLRDFANLRVGVDAYVWLHKATYCCSFELCRNIPTDKYIQYCLKWVRMLQSNNIIPILVFDGGHLPVKGDKEIERRKRRNEYKQKAEECMSKGDKKTAYENYQKCVDVTPKMAFNLIRALQMIGVQYIVAPYEADAQLAYLARNNLVDAVITEDSDLIPYGASRIIFKLDKNGNGKEIRLADLGQVTELDFSSFTSDMLRHMCVLSGCDYAGSIPGLGVKKAYNLLKKYRDIEKVFKAIKLDKGLTMPKDYELAFKRADLTFMHQRVYDPVQRKVVTLTPLPEEALNDPELDWSFLGPELEDDVGRRIAEGIIDPHSKKPFETDTPAYNPNRTPHPKVVGKEVKIYAQKRRAMTTSAKNNTVVQRNTISNYFVNRSSSTLNSSKSSLNVSVGANQSEDNSVFDEDSNDSGFLPNMAKSTASMDNFDDFEDFAGVDFDAMFENSNHNNSNSNHSAEQFTEEQKGSENQQVTPVILAPATPSPKKKVLIVRSKYFDQNTPLNTPQLDESTDLLLKSLSKSRDIDQDDIFASLDEDDKSDLEDFETPINGSANRMLRDMARPIATSTPAKLARNLNTEFLQAEKSFEGSDGDSSPMGPDDIFTDEKGNKKSSFFQALPFKPFSSPLIKSSGRLSLRTTQTINSSAVTIMTDKDQQIETKTILKKTTAIFSSTRQEESNSPPIAENGNSGDSFENNNDGHNKSDDNLFDAVSKELKTNSDSNTNKADSEHDSLDDFQVDPPKQTAIPKKSEPSSDLLDSDKENSPVIDKKPATLFDKLNLNRFSFKRKEREGDTEQQPAKKLKTSASVSSRVTFVNSSSSAIVIDD